VGTLLHRKRCVSPMTPRYLSLPLGDTSSCCNSSSVKGSRVGVSITKPTTLTNTREATGSGKVGKNLQIVCSLGMRAHKRCGCWAAMRSSTSQYASFSSSLALSARRVSRASMTSCRAGPSWENTVANKASLSLRKTKGEQDTLKLLAPSAAYPTWL
jgi:hypothetical protein